MAGLKFFPATDLPVDKPESIANFFSDDKEALEKVVELFKNTNIKIGKADPLVGAREEEALLWEFQQTVRIFPKYFYLIINYLCSFLQVKLKQC